MTEIEPLGNLGAVAGAETGGDNGFLALAARVVNLTRAAWRLREGMHQLQQHMEKNATMSTRLSEMCAAAEVEPAYTASILEVGEAFHRVATASGELADTADTMATNAQAFNDAHEREYRGVYEAVQASKVRQARPGFYRHN